MTAMVGASAVAASMLMMVEPSGTGLQGVWAALAVLMVGRLATLGWRFQSEKGPLPPSSAKLPEQQQQHQLAEVEQLQQQQVLLLQELQQRQHELQHTGEQELVSKQQCMQKRRSSCDN